MKLFLKGIIFLCGFVFCVYAAPSAISGKPVTFSSLSQLVDALIKAQPEKKSLEEDILVAHKRFIELLDPEKSYFLESEVVPFLDPSRKKEFVLEFSKGSFRSYKEIVLLYQQAIGRSRAIREKLKGNALQKEISTKEFPKNSAQLEERVAHLFFDKDAKNQMRKIELEKHEESWLAYNEEFFAQTILKSVLSTLDINSDVMGNRDARFMREKLTKQASGTGIICESVRNNIFIAQIQKGSPADHLGVFDKGDTLLSIEGKSCYEMSLEEVDELLRTKNQGSLLIAWEKLSGGVFEQNVPLQSFTVEEGRVQGQMYHNILVATIPALYSNEKGVSTSEDLAAIILRTGQKQHISGILLDLRGNGGGYLTEAVSVCGLFVKTGVIMSAMYANGQKAVYRDVDPRILFDGPIVILVSESTASAAEIVAQSLKDYGKAIIVGSERTFGKGSIQLQTVTDTQEQKEMPLRYTVGKFYSVSGLSPNGTGVTSDIVLPGFQKNIAHGISAATLPEKVSSYFYDGLNDLDKKTRDVYLKKYIPYLQKKEYRYRRLIPYLKEKNQARTKKNAEAKNGSDVHLQEALNILEDLVEKISK